MKKKIKKLIFSLALAAGIALVTAAVCSFAETGEVTVNGIKYSYDTSTHTASVIGDIYFDPDYGDKNMNDAPEIEIPSTIAVNGDGGYTVTAVGEKAFYGCESLTRITIPSSVTTIGDQAFYYCDSLQSVTLPESLETIGDQAFYHCESLQSVTLPESLETIGDQAFYRCDSLQSITIPAGVESIANDAFIFCSNLTAIDVNANNNNYSSANGILYDKNKTTLIKYPEGKNGTYFTIPNTVTTIGDYAFRGCSSLTSITIPEGVTTIGDSAFSGCRSLTSITIPEGAETIGESAFLFCSSLTSITIPKRVTTIGKAAFYECRGLTSVTIPEGVTKIEDLMFYLCSGLTDAFIPSGATIGTNAFGKTAPANVWRYSVNATAEESIDGKTHVTITSVEDKDGNPSSVSGSLACDAMGENYVIDAVTIEGVQLEHTLAHTPAKAATCTEAGHIEGYTCSHCNKHFSDAEGTTEIAEGDWVISATGHDLEKTEAVEPTCTTEGNAEYWTCSHCGKHFSDAEGTTEIAEGDWVIPIDENAHDWGEVSYTWAEDNSTCKAERVCTVCDLKEEETMLATSEVTISATCTESGVKTYTATFANSAFSEQRTTEPILALGHNMTEHPAVAETCTEAGNTEYWTCDRCGKYFSDENAENEIQEGDWVVPALGHNMTAHVAKAATCTEAGHRSGYTCSHCGKHFSDAAGTTEIAEGDWVIPATGHDWSNWMPDPDNTENHKRTCTVCEAVQTEPHNWSDPEVTKEVTDTEDGEMKYVCKTCGAEKVEEVPALENYVTDPLLEQTVDKDGVQIKLMVQDPYKVLPEGVQLEITELDDERKAQLDPTHPIENVAFFDIKLYTVNEDGVKTYISGELARKVRILWQIPEGWDEEDMEAVRITVGGDIDFDESIVTIGGVNYLAFWTNHFSPYASIDELTDADRATKKPADPAETAKKTNSTEESGSIETGDEINSYIMLEMVLFLASASLFVALRRRQKILLNEKK